MGKKEGESSRFCAGIMAVTNNTLMLIAIKPAKSFQRLRHSINQSKAILFKLLLYIHFFILKVNQYFRLFHNRFNQ